VKAEFLEKIKGRGHWHIIIRPKVFVEERIPTLGGCQRIIEQNQIRFRGWSFPYLDSGSLQRKLDHIEHCCAFRFINETWRFYQSGQFVYFGGLVEDWLENDPTQSGSVLSILSVLYRLSEVYEFATRLAQQEVFGDSVVLKVNLVGMKDRLLWSQNPSELLAWGLERGYQCGVAELPRERTFEVGSLVAQSREHSFEHFSWVMDRFGFVPSDVIFKGEQAKFLKGLP